MFINCKVIADNVSYEDYSRQPDGVRRGHPNYIISRSELIDFSLCPGKWLASEAGDDSTAATNYGSLLDCLLTSPERFRELFVMQPETYTNAKKEVKEWTLRSNTCKEWVAEKRKVGLTVLTPKVWNDAQSAAKVMRQNPDAVELLRVSRKQVHVTGIWKDKATGLEIPLRALLDLVPPKEHPAMGKWLADLKSARSGDPDRWARVVDDCGYDVQAAMYGDLWNEANRETEFDGKIFWRTDWVFLVSENTPPFHVVNPMPAMSSEFLQYGRMKYQSALAYYAQCLDSGNWPSYRVAGTLYPPGKPVIQLIGPEDLWTYRKTAGQGSLGSGASYEPQSEPVKSNDDIIRLVASMKWHSIGILAADFTDGLGCGDILRWWWGVVHRILLLCSTVHHPILRKGITSIIFPCSNLCSVLNETPI
jgi:hypothetical protein